jgi:hypothetical protein
VLSKRAAIDVASGSSLRAGHKMLLDAYNQLLDSAGNVDQTPGQITVENAHLIAEAIRLRGFAQGADALVIDGSTLSASQLIELFAEGASTIRFRNDVTLKTALAILAGQTVEVDPGGNVQITGKGKVYTDHANFNSGGFGTIQASKGLSVGQFSKAPPFKP